MCAGVPCMSAGQKLEPGTRTRTKFAMLGPAEKRVCKRRISATFSGTRTIFIRTVPRIFGSVNGLKPRKLYLKSHTRCPMCLVTWAWIGSEAGVTLLNALIQTSLLFTCRSRCSYCYKIDLHMKAVRFVSKQSHSSFPSNPRPGH